MSIHIKLKEKIEVRRNRKFKAAHRQYLKMTFEQGHKKENLKMLLDKRRETLFEICTRLYEEERKKAEQEITEVNNVKVSHSHVVCTPVTVGSLYQATLGT